MNPSIRKAQDKFTLLSESPEFREAYEQRFKAQVDYNSQINGARKEGMEEGMKKGIKTGIKEGKKEEKIETALRLLEEGLSLKIIARATQLTEEEIKKLKDKN